jgi:hypothetical protein
VSYDKKELIEKYMMLGVLVGFAHSSINMIIETFHDVDQEDPKTRLQELYDRMTPRIIELFYKDEKEIKDE